MKRLAQLLLLSIVVMPPAFAESAQNEYASNWFLNVQTQNWTCSVFAGKTAIGGGAGVGQCKARPEYLQHLAFAFAQPVKVWDGTDNRYYFFVEEWGAPEGPGSECNGDSILIFEVPYSANGARALQTTPIYRGTASPCGATEPHWVFASAFQDPLTGGATLVGQRNVADSVAGGAFRDVWIGESKPSGGVYGKNFAWKKLFDTSIAGHNIYHLYVVPDADGKTWRGFMENSYGAGWGATPVIVDRVQNTVRYKTSATLWTTISVGGTMTVPPYRQVDGFMSSFAKVNGRYELWLDNGGPRSNVKPMTVCDATKYAYNVGDSPGGLNRAGANAPRYIVMDANLNALTAALPLMSATHPVPSDEHYSIGGPRATNITGMTGSTIYYGSNDWSVCSIYLTNWNHWSGMGIKWGRLETW